MGEAAQTTNLLFREATQLERERSRWWCRTKPRPMPTNAAIRTRLGK